MNRKAIDPLLLLVSVIQLVAERHDTEVEPARDSPVATMRHYLVLTVLIGGMGLIIGGCLAWPNGRGIDVDGTAYPLTSAGINQALQDACGGRAGVVFLPGAVVSGLDGTISVPSNCTLLGRGTGDSILQAKPGLRSPLILVDQRTNVVLRSFTADANRNDIDAIRISNSSTVHVSSVRGTNAALCTGLAILYASNDIPIEESEFDRSGVSLPAADGGGIGVSPGALTMKRFALLATACTTITREYPFLIALMPRRIWQT